MKFFSKSKQIAISGSLLAIFGCAPSNGAVKSNAKLTQEQKMGLLYEGDTIQIFIQGKTPTEQNLARCIHFSSKENSCVVADPKPGSATNNTLPVPVIYTGTCAFQIQNQLGVQTVNLCFLGPAGNCPESTSVSPTASGILATISPSAPMQEVTFDISSPSSRWQINRYHICSKLFAPGSIIPAIAPEPGAAFPGGTPRKAPSSGG